MTDIPLAKTNFHRAVAATPLIPIRNRFLEGNPVLNDSQFSLIARPALKKFMEVGSGPIRKLFNEPGVFGGDLFVVSNTDLYRVSAETGTATLIGDIGPVPGDPSMAATAPIGEEPAHLFIASGSALWLYMEDDGLSEVDLPVEVGAISVAHINSYVIVIPVQSEASVTVGQFYWIKPGEITIDPLDYATAERAPDNLHQVIVYGDMFWLLGQKTTEPWVTVGNLDAPMQRYTGILFDRGSWEGSAIQVKDSLILIDEDGAAFQYAGGQNRISRPDVEEVIRRAIQIQAAS
ncbi:hypothetical protein NT2_01_04660 [Caenibius tardaugens NBRC 16725]|uniref:Uncharacterized protein n=1 Tax=Caenibius tardaugens NBRC 16725 TaxID=1219035 RepID=U2ZYU5_9SPHN|nr:hypothetical protein [Caenibius tardaugens]AZI37075.1 hypothetical protein EGO55_14815 [Caenibius tardaugens NBRC 16725]GAD47693.1 hypothetical protein NT2_01_04660 [Caenibius tardaugens NBRC 16725]